MFKDAKTIAGLVITGTVCASLLIPVIGSMFHVGEVSETFRVKIFDLIMFLGGIASGWLLGSGSKDPPKE